MRISVIIPALNEEEAIGRVIRDIPDWVDQIVVVDNGSTDRTSEVARAGGATVVQESRRGYGQACLTGINATNICDIIVFIDGDYSDFAEEMDLLVDPVVEAKADLVIGSRTSGTRDRGSLTPQQRFGNWLACLLIRLLWGVRFTDLGPFRAIRQSSLGKLRMSDKGYGWTIEMQIRSIQMNLAIIEVPVRYRNRIGVSKISGTLKGTVLAGMKILATIATHAFRSGTRFHHSSHKQN